jgi:DNA-binding response OmpR family regulator
MRPPAVLLVEVDPQAASAIELYLHARGHRVTYVPTAAAAIREAVVTPPAIVIVGGYDGLVDAAQVAQRLRTLIAPQDVAIIALSSEMGAAEGADVTLPKPCHPRAVLDGIRTAVRMRNARLARREATVRARELRASDSTTSK